MFDSHMHTPLCKHAVGMPDEYAAMAVQRNLSGIIFTCHNPAPDGWSPHIRMSREEFDEYVAMIAETTSTWSDRIDVLLGLESDYIPGMERYLEDLHSKANFHYILGSVHPHLKDYKKLFLRSDIQAFQELYFEHLALAAETGLFNCLSHPDLVKNTFPKDWRLEAMLPAIEKALDRIQATGIAMELNTSGLLKCIPEMNPSEPILERIAARGIPIVLGSDSHRPDRVGDQFLQALTMLEQAGFDRVSHFVERVRVETPIATCRTKLTP